MTAIAELQLSVATQPWERVGLQVVDGSAWVGGVRLRFVAPGGAAAAGQPMQGWTLAGSPSDPDMIDGLVTSHVTAIEPQSWQHPLGVTGIDHVVVMTSSLERTCGEIERVTGEPLKRVREAGAVRQGFHRFGASIVEVVESGDVISPVAQFWGFVMVVDDLHDAAGALGPDVLSAPRQAVQPGRMIASFRAAAGLGLPVALMSPHVR